MIYVANSYFNTVNDFKQTNPAKKLIINAMMELAPTKGNRVGFIISIIVALFFSIVIGCSPNTVSLLSKVANTLLTIQLAIFGCVFTVYSIILAFLSDGYMKRLAKVDYKDKASMLKQSTTYYESVLFLYFINIGLSGLVTLITDCINSDFRLTTNIIFDTILSVILLFVYFFYSFRVFYEIKSTIYNTIILFRASIAYRFIDFEIEENSDDEEGSKKDGH